MITWPAYYGRKIPQRKVFVTSRSEKTEYEKTLTWWISNTFKENGILPTSSVKKTKISNTLLSFGTNSFPNLFQTQNNNCNNLSSVISHKGGCCMYYVHTHYILYNSYLNTYNYPSTRRWKKRFRKRVSVVEDNLSHIRTPNIFYLHQAFYVIM